MSAKSKRPDTGDYLANLDGPSPATTPPVAKRPSAAKPKGPTPRTKMTFDLPVTVVHELRAAVVSLSPQVIGGNISALVARSIEAELERLRKVHNSGRVFETDGATPVPRGPVRRG